jgi:hypothetical protein
MESRSLHLHARVTRCDCEKIAQNVAQCIYVKINALITLTANKSSPTMGASMYCNLQKMPN